VTNTYTIQNPIATVAMNTNPTPAVAVVGSKTPAQAIYTILLVYLGATNLTPGDLEPLGQQPVVFEANTEGLDYECRVELIDGEVQVQTRIPSGEFDNRPLWRAHQARQVLALMGPWQDNSPSR